MKKFLKSLTIFFIVGTVFFLIGIYGLYMVGMGGINESIFGIYVSLFLLPTSVVILAIDRICVWKFGSKKVNKIELYILLGYIGIEIISWIGLLLSGQL